MKGQRGFTLLEAIVALVLIASVGVAIFGWINTQMITLSRVQHANARDMALRNVLTLVDDINPMRQPQGSVETGPYQVSWVSEPVEPVRDGTSNMAALGLYQVGLYELRLSVRDSARDESFEFSLRRAGYRQQRPSDQ